MKKFLYVWFSELNHWMTKYGCDNLNELETVLLKEHGTILFVL